MQTSACCFFGHRDLFETEELKSKLTFAIEKLITDEKADKFYVGNQGIFDSMVLGCLARLIKSYPHISISVVLAYMPAGKQKNDPIFEHSIFPEELAQVHPRFAIERRNKWMISKSAFCLCCINYLWGGACKFAAMPRKKGSK